MVGTKSNVGRPKGSKNMTTLARGEEPARRSTREIKPVEKLVMEPVEGNRASQMAKRGKGRARKSEIAVATPKRGRGRPRLSEGATNLINKHLGRPAGSAKKPAAPVATAPVVKPAEFSMENITGLFDVVSTNINDEDPVTMAITSVPGNPNRAVGYFDFGSLAGALRLSISKADLAAWATEDAEESDIEVRKTRSAKASKVSKISLRNNNHYTRIYFRWRGREEAADENEDDLLFHEDEIQTGHLDFPHIHGDVFWGLITMPAPLGDGVALQGTRVPQAIVVPPLAWEEFAAPEEEGDRTFDSLNEIYKSQKTLQKARK